MLWRHTGPDTVILWYCPQAMSDRGLTTITGCLMAVNKMTCSLNESLDVRLSFIFIYPLYLISNPCREWSAKSVFMHLFLTGLNINAQVPLVVQKRSMSVSPRSEKVPLFPSCRAHQKVCQLDDMRGRKKRFEFYQMHYI